MTAHPDVKKLAGRFGEGFSASEILRFADEAQQMHFPDADGPGAPLNLGCIGLVRALCYLHTDPLRQDICSKFKVAAERLAEHGGPQLALLARWYHAVAELTWLFRDDDVRLHVTQDDYNEALEALQMVVALAEDTSPRHAFLAYSLIAECYQRRGEAESARRALMESNNVLGLIDYQDPTVELRVRANARMAETQCEGALRFMRDYRVLIGTLLDFYNAL